MPKIETSFSPVRDGFKFVNFFELRFPVKFSLPFVHSINLEDVVFGLCGGMCFAALDYFNANRRLPDSTDPKAIDKKLFTYLCERQLDSLQIPVVLKIIEWMVSEDDDIARRVLRTELPRLRRSIDKGSPVVLCLIRVKGIQDPTRNHQVLATGYDIDSQTGNVRIELYDPNHPGETIWLNVTPGVPGRGFSLTQSSGEPLRGFFIISYRTRKSLPKEPALEEIAFGAGVAEVLPFRLRWPVDSRVVNQFFGENPRLYKAFNQAGHEGLDLFAPSGANVYACFDGEVYEAKARGEYGLQVRIKHAANGVDFRTVYAHLQKAFVQEGQQVKAGDLIGLADNSGNSFGSHLHLTLKINGATTPGYPAEIVDPWPYLEGSEPALTPGTPDPSGVSVITTGRVNLRKYPATNSDILATLPAGETLPVLGDANRVRETIGKEDLWLQVQTASGLVGYVAAWLVENADLQAFPPSGLVVYPFDQVDIVSGPGTAFNRLAVVSSTEPLIILGNADSAQEKISKEGHWLQVQTQSGLRGFTAAWLVRLTGQVPPPAGLVVYPTGTVNVRARPSTDANILTVVTSADTLTVLGDPQQVWAKVGKEGEWLNVQAPGRFTGYVAAWYVTTERPEAIPSGANGNGFVVVPTVEVNIRTQPSINSPRVNGAMPGELLTVIDTDPAAAKQKIGRQEQWLYVQKANGARGWVAAWYVKTGE